MNAWLHTTRGVAILIALLACTSTMRAQVITVTAGEFTKVGLSGGQFLKIGVGARANGMAGAYSGLANDVTAIFWNAAGLVDVKEYGVDFSHTFWFASMSHSFAAGVIPLSEKFRLAASFTGFSSGDIMVTTTAQQDGTGGIYNVNDIAVGLTLAGELTEQFAFGLTGRYVNNAFSDMAASGVVFDIGTRYKTGFNGLTVAFSVNNLGTEQHYDGSNTTTSTNPVDGVNQAPVDAQMQTSKFSVPLSFRAGLGIDMFQGIMADAPETDVDGTKLHQWLVGADFETYADVPEQFAIGTEYTFREFISLRAGYRFGNDQFGISGGVGLRYQSGTFLGRLDYSISPTETLGLINRVSIGLNFD